MKVAGRGPQTCGFAHAGWPRTDSVGFLMTRAKADLKLSRFGHAAAMRMSMRKVISKNDLSFQAASQSERLDNATGLQYGLELVIPMSSRGLEKR
jgi:hypothetical protein